MCVPPNHIACFGTSGRQCLPDSCRQSFRRKGGAKKAVLIDRRLLDCRWPVWIVEAQLIRRDMVGQLPEFLQGFFPQRGRHCAWLDQSSASDIASMAYLAAELAPMLRKTLRPFIELKLTIRPRALRSSGNVALIMATLPR